MAVTSTIMVTGFEALATAQNGSVILTGFETYATPSIAKVAMVEFQVFASASATNMTRLTGFEAFSDNNTVAAVISVNQTEAEPGQTVILSLASSSGTPDYYSIVQIPDPTGRVPTVALSNPDGITRQFTSPVFYPDMDKNNPQPFMAKFTGTVSLGGAQTSTQDIFVRLFPHLMWQWSLGSPPTRVPIAIGIIPGVQ